MSAVRYTDQEREALVQLVLERVDLIEKKSNDALTLEHKQMIWSDIVNRFNSDMRCSSQRDVLQIRKLWDNIKTRARRMVADQQLQISCMAVGPGEVQSASSTSDPEGYDPDEVPAEDSNLVEKVLYYMRKKTPQSVLSTTTSMHWMSFDEDAVLGADNGDGHQLRAETDKQYEFMVKEEDEDDDDDVVYCEDYPTSPKTSSSIGSQSNRQVTNSLCSQSKLRLALEQPNRCLPPSGDTRRLTQASSTEFIENRTQFHPESSSPASSSHNSVSISAPIHRTANSVSSHHREATPSASSSMNASPGTMTTISKTTTPSGSECRVPPKLENCRNNQSASERSSGKRGGQNLKRLRREECELRIQKLREEVKFARVEHEERIKVMQVQQEVLNSLKSNPSAVIQSLFK